MELKHRGLLRSRRGRRGGYYLVVPATKISLAAVMRAFETPLAPLACMSSTLPNRCPGCTSETTCAVRLVLMEVYESSVRGLETTTVADLMARGEREARGRE
jgi:Rrf2 family protein